MPESEFDLEKLFLPAWAQESPSVNKYASFSGEERSERDERGGRRRGRSDFPRGGERGRSGPRPERSFDRSSRPPQNRERGQRPPREAPREAPLPLPELNITIEPDEKGVELLAHQIRVTGRAYPLFDIARLVLQKPERQQVRFETIKKNGQAAQPLFLCALDDSLWLSEEEAVSHVLSRHFNTFYQTERTATEPPKGTYTFVAQCGMSGVVLGPPNYHDYQNQLRKLHAERFSRLPFEAFKARVKIVRDEAIVKKWIEDHSFKTEFVCLNVPEAVRLASREEVQKHFREVHLASIIKPVDSHTLSGPAARLLRSSPLQRLLRSHWEDQRRFPLQVATVLSQKFATHGLQFFKVNKTVTHVSIARPHFLDLEATPVSEGVRKIVQLINTTPKCSRRTLLESLAPAPAAGPVVDKPEGAATQPEATPEQTALIADLHWLIHQGHVIEFANGILETAKKPVPKPPKAEPKAGVAEASPETAEVAAEVVVENAGAEEKAASPVADAGGSPVAPTQTTEVSGPTEPASSAASQVSGESAAG